MVTGANISMKGTVSIGTGATVWSRGDKLSVSGSWVEIHGNKLIVAGDVNMAGPDTMDGIMLGVVLLVAGMDNKAHGNNLHVTGGGNMTGLVITMEMIEVNGDKTKKAIVGMAKGSMVGVPGHKNIAIMDNVHAAGNNLVVLVDGVTASGSSVLAIGKNGAVSGNNIKAVNENVAVTGNGLEIVVVAVIFLVITNGAVYNPVGANLVLIASAGKVGVEWITINAVVGCTLVILIDVTNGS